MDFYPSLNQPTKEPIYRLVFFPLQSATSNLVRQHIKTREIRWRRHGDTSTGKNDERTVLLRLEKTIREIHASYAHTFLAHSFMLNIHSDRLYAL